MTKKVFEKFGITDETLQTGKASYRLLAVTDFEELFRVLEARLLIAGVVRSLMQAQDTHDVAIRGHCDALTTMETRRTWPQIDTATPGPPDIQAIYAQMLDTKRNLGYDLGRSKYQRMIGHLLSAFPVRGMADPMSAQSPSKVLWRIVHRDRPTDGDSAAFTTLLPDVLGNPFRPVTFDPSWRTSVTLALAEGIYGDQAFDRMPILADALQDAGCEDEQVLNHCRETREHIRGCWVVEGVLRKS